MLFDEVVLHLQLGGVLPVHPLHPLRLLPEEISKKRRISKMLPYSNDQLVPVEIPHNPDVALNYLVATIAQLWWHLHWVLDFLRFVHILKDLHYL